MALPWHLALRAIPWHTILTNAPALAQSARALLSRERREEADQHAALEPLVERVAALERRDHEQAELVAQLVAQNTALTTATEILVARVRWLAVGTGAALVVAVVALGVALLRSAA